ncbi:MAG: DNA repair protein RecO [Methylomicrobium sp.]
MNEFTVLLQPAYILHYRQFRETSLIAEVLTRDFGRLALLAKGVRNPKSKFAPLIRPFIPVLLSFTGRSELKTLTHIESSQNAPELHGIALYCGFYLNELLGFLLHAFDPHPEIFHLYEQTLSALSNSSEQEHILRRFEINLLSHIGYGLQFDYDNRNQRPVSAQKHYAFDAESGPVEDEGGLFAGNTLLAMANQTFDDTQILIEAKKIMRTVIDFHLNGKKLKSRAVISKILQQNSI